MARIRSIKPEFWTSPQLAECSLNARLTFIGLWTFADDNGVQIDSAKRIKMQCFPADEVASKTVDQWLVELAVSGLIHRYEANGEKYIIIPSWRKHQRIDQPTYLHPLPSGEIPATPPRRRDGQNSPDVRRTFNERSTSVQGRRGEDRSGQDRNGEESTNTTAPAKAVADSAAGFDEFWKAYPKKKSKGAALKMWKKLKPPLAEILTALEWQRLCDQWRKEGGQFIPYPATYLHDAGWEDEPENNRAGAVDADELARAQAEWDRKAEENERRRATE